jgi:hypothetical protein
MYFLPGNFKAMLKLQTVESDILFVVVLIKKLIR